MITKSKRIKRFLYNLGFEFTVINTNGKEEYSFPESSQLQESIDSCNCDDSGNEYSSLPFVFMTVNSKPKLYKNLLILLDLVII